MKTECNYPDCKCPFDMGADNKCLQGLPKMDKNIKHDMRNKSATGHGKWEQCEKCGATNHSGSWWLGGYEFKKEPPCKPHNKRIDLYEGKVAECADKGGMHT